MTIRRPTVSPESDYSYTDKSSGRQLSLTPKPDEAMVTMIHNLLCRFPQHSHHRVVQERRFVIGVRQLKSSEYRQIVGDKGGRTHYEPCR